MMVSTPLRPFVHLVGRHAPNCRVALMALTSTLKTSITIVTNRKGDSAIKRALLTRDKQTKTTIEKSCSGVFPLILNVAVIDAETVHLAFADLVAFTEFRLTDGAELEMREVRFKSRPQRALW